jgi:hypothetical protein
MCSVLLVAVLALVGCAGGDDGASSTTTTSTTLPRLSTTTVVVDPPGKADGEDQQAARTALLKASDLAGSQSSPWPTGDQPFFASAKDSCAYLHFVDATSGLTASAHSDILRSTGLDTVAVKVQVYPTEADAKAVMTAFTRVDSSKCVSSTVSAATSGATSGSPAVNLAEQAVSVPGAVAFFGTVDGGAGLSVSIGYAFAQAGRALVLLVANGAGNKAPDFNAYLAPVVGRLSNLR